MKSTEFRNGNYLSVNSKIVPIIIYDDSFTFNLSNEYKNPLLSFTDEKVKPVILNEDILLKCGFKKGLENNYHLGIIRIWIEPQYNMCFLFYDTALRIELFGLHDLQNAYYLLMDKQELNINF